MFDLLCEQFSGATVNRAVMIDVTIDPAHYAIRDLQIDIGV